jgi:hypothetical protein
VPPVPPEIKDEIKQKFILSIRKLKPEWTKDNKVVILKVMYHFRNFFTATYLAKNCGLLNQILKTEIELQKFLERVRTRSDCPQWLKASAKNMASPTKYKFRENQFTIDEYCDILIKTPSIKVKFEEARVPGDRQDVIFKLVEGNDWKNALDSATTTNNVLNKH